MNGSILLGGNITWSTGSSPTQALYATTALTKPANGAKWSSYPTSGTGWHQTFASTDRYATYTYDGGGTWTTAILVQGKDGQSGAPGRPGTDAYVTRANLVAVILNATTEDGLYTTTINGVQTLGIKASAIQAGIITADIEMTTPTLQIGRDLLLRLGSSAASTIYFGTAATAQLRGLYTQTTPMVT
jgi:hypothetical protein